MQAQGSDDTGWLPEVETVRIGEEDTDADKELVKTAARDKKAGSERAVINLSRSSMALLVDRFRETSLSTDNRAGSANSHSPSC
jgi:hypothetical protein